MDTVLGVITLWKVLGAFGLILLLNRLRLNLGLALLIGSAALAVMMGLGPRAAAMAYAKGILDAEVLSLIVAVVFLLVVSRLMSDTGQLERLVTSFQGLIPGARMTSLILPALIGLLPMPGGALFSAPMIQTACERTSAGPELKTALNYWFRHLWEVWWPLYPGVVLAVSLLGVPAWRFILGGLPLTGVIVLGGMILLWPALKEDRPPDARPGTIRERLKDFGREVRPITLVVLAVPAVQVVELVLGWDLPPLSAVFLGLVLCLTEVIRRNRIPWRQVAQALTNKTIPPMVLLILAIMAFRGMLVESRAVQMIQAELTREGIPTLCVILAMPFLSGMVTGIAMGMVGASFPLVVPLIAHLSGLDHAAHAALAYAFGYLGMMLSPVHLCLLVTRDFFGANLLGSYRYLVGPALFFVAGSFLLFGITRLFI
jgi:integral membrane protein (TIGR00529 family)